MNNLEEQLRKYDDEKIYQNFETKLKALSKYDKQDRLFKGFSPDKLNEVLNLEEQFNEVLIKRYEQLNIDPLFKDGAYKHLNTNFKAIILDTINMFNVWYDQICYNSEINQEVNPLQRLNSDKKYAKSFKAFYDEAVGVLKNLDENVSNKLQYKRKDKNLINKLAKNENCSPWEYLTQVVAPSYLDEFKKNSSTKTKFLRETLEATLNTHLIDKRTYHQTRNDIELNKKLAVRLLRPTSPDWSVSSDDSSNISSLTSGSSGYTTDEGSTYYSKSDARLKSKSSGSASSNSSTDTKNTGTTNSVKSEKPEEPSVQSLVSMFERNANPLVTKGPKGPKGPKA
tara:strand:+ start:638 stop:1657 length:1020 start_codon:yes stop_codon:yes gene_type:complete